MKSILILSATIQEASPTLKVLEGKIPFEYKELGVGVFEVASSLAMIQDFSNYSSVLYIGTAGIFGPFSSPFLVSADKVLWSPTCERLGLSKRPANRWPPLQLTNLTGLKSATIWTSSGVSLTAKVDQGINEDQLIIENMEAYAVVRGIPSSIPVWVVMGITNQVGPNGSKEWYLNNEAVAKITAEWILSRVSTLQIGNC